MFTEKAFTCNGCRTSACSEGRLASNNTALNTALIGAAGNSEVSLVAPIRVPAVCHLPKRSTVFNAPSENSDGVATKGLSSSVRIDAGLVCKEVLIHSECSFNGAMSHDLGLNGSLSGNAVVALALDLLLAFGL